MRSYLIPALRMSAVMLVLCCGLYTLIVWGFARVAGPGRGRAELVQRNSRPVGAVLVGQQFTSDRYFQGRPSAIDYKAEGSSGSNKGPSNPEYLATVEARIDTFLVHNPDVHRIDIPSELVTASGSGLDPDISPTAAQVQIPRVANRRGLSVPAVEELVRIHTHGPLLGLFGPPTINVLELNLALDQLNDTTPRP